MNLLFSGRSLHCMPGGSGDLAVPAGAGVTIFDFNRATAQTFFISSSVLHRRLEKNSVSFPSSL